MIFLSFSISGVIYTSQGRTGRHGSDKNLVLPIPYSPSHRSDRHNLIISFQGLNSLSPSTQPYPFQYHLKWNLLVWI